MLSECALQASQANVNNIDATLSNMLDELDELRAGICMRDLAETEQERRHSMAHILASVDRLTTLVEEMQYAAG